jgi:hypothetical protein
MKSTFFVAFVHVRSHPFTVFLWSICGPFAISPGHLFRSVASGNHPTRTKASALPEPVRVLVDPQGRGRQHIAARLAQLTGTRAGGFVLTRQEAAGKWCVAIAAWGARA